MVLPAVLLEVGESPEEVVALRANEGGVLKSKRCAGSQSWLDKRTRSRASATLMRAQIEFMLQASIVTLYHFDKARNEREGGAICPQAVCTDY